MLHSTLDTVCDAIIDKLGGSVMQCLCVVRSPRWSRWTCGCQHKDTPTSPSRALCGVKAPCSKAQILKKVLYILTLYSKYTGTLTFENLCQSVEEELHCHHGAVAPFLVRTACVCRGAMVQPAPPGGSGAEACHVYLLADAAVFRQVLE